MGALDGTETTLDAAWAIVMGQLNPSLITSGRATGYTATSAAVNKIIRATAYAAQGTNAQRSLASTSAADSGSGTGAQQVTVTYLDASFAVHTETVTLNGTTAVNTVGTNYAYLESMVVVQVGTAEGTNLGVIEVFTGTAGGGTVWGSIAENPTTSLTGTVTVTNGSPNITFSVAQSIPAGSTLFFSSQPGVGYVLSAAVAGTAGTLTTNYTGTTSSTATTMVGVGDNQTFWAAHYVPAGVTCYIVSMQASSIAVLGIMSLIRHGNPSLSNLPQIQIGPTVLHPGGDQREHQFIVPLAVPGPDLIEMLVRPTAATADTSFGNFEYVQF